MKKGGGGGKFTWGNVLTDNYDTPALDAADPNYDSDEDASHQVVYATKHDQFKAEVEAFKQQVGQSLYIASCSMALRLL